MGCGWRPCRYRRPARQERAVGGGVGGPFRDAARSLDSSGAFDRQGVGLVLAPVLLMGSLAKGKAIALLRRIFDLLFVAYHDGAMRSLRTLPAVAVRATRSVFPRSLQSRAMPGGGPSSQT